MLFVVGEVWMMRWTGDESTMHTGRDYCLSGTTVDDRAGMAAFGLSGGGYGRFLPSGDGLSLPTAIEIYGSFPLPALHEITDGGVVLPFPLRPSPHPALFLEPIPETEALVDGMSLASALLATSDVTTRYGG